MTHKIGLEDLVHHEEVKAAEISVKFSKKLEKFAKRSRFVDIND